MGQIVELGIENYSHLKQRCELHNVTQVPTNTGNASVQLATFPNVEVQQDPSFYLNNGEVFHDVQRCFNWIIYKIDRGVGIQGRYQIRAKKLTGSSPLPQVNFPTYNEPSGNKIQPFQSLEFIDLDGLRWILILSYAGSYLRVYKFRDDSTFSIITEEQFENNVFSPDEFTFTGSDVNTLYEVFIEGTLFSYYKQFQKYDVPGYFNYPLTQGKNFNTFKEFIDLVKSSLQGNLADKTQTVLMITDKLRKLFQVHQIGHTSTNNSVSAPGYYSDPATYTWYAGLAGIRNLRGGISQGSDGVFKSGRQHQKRNDSPGMRSHYGLWDRWVDDDRDRAYRNALDRLFTDLGSGTFTQVNFGSTPVQVLNWAGASLMDEREYSKNQAILAHEITSVLNRIRDDINTVITQGGTLGPTFINEVFFWNSPGHFGGILEGSEVSFDFSNSSPGEPYGGWYAAWLQGGSVRVASNVTRQDYNATAFNADGKKSWEFDNSLHGNLTLNYRQYAEISINKVLGVIDEANGLMLSTDSTKAWKNLAEAIVSYLQQKVFSNTRPGIPWLLSEMKDLQDELNRRQNNYNSDDTLSYNYQNELDIVAGLIIVIEQFQTNVQNLIDVCNTLISEINANPTATILKQRVIDWANDIQNNSGRNYALDNLLNQFTDIQNRIASLNSFLIINNSDSPIIDIESIAHMLIVVTDNDRFYYSDTGTTNINGLNFYSAEYANSKPIETWRLANRLVMFTNNTIEFWDITNDFEDPLSPAYSSNVWTMTVLQNSRVKFNDTLYFIAKPIELDTYSIYSLTKNGQLNQLSYPQLDSWINEQIFTRLNEGYNPLETNWNFDINGSIINYENAPIIQWKLKKGVKVLNFNVMFNSFFLSDNLYFLENDDYYQLYSNKVGSLTSYFNEDQTRVCGKLITVNTNDFFQETKPNKKYKSVMAFHGDVDLENHKNILRDNLSENKPIIKDQWNYKWQREEPLDEIGNVIPDTYQKIHHKFYRVSRMPWRSLRTVRISPRSGNRNLNYRVIGIGMGIDFQTEMTWSGFLRINGLSYEVE